MSFKTIAGGFNGAFWWYGPLSEDQEILKQIYQNYLVALKYLLFSPMKLLFVDLGSYIFKFHIHFFF